MEVLKLHSFGQNDFLEILKKKYDFLRKSIIENEKLTESEIKLELEKLRESFIKEKKNSSDNLY